MKTFILLKHYRGVLVVTLLSFLAVGCQRELDDEEETPPVAGFTYTSVQALPATVTFTNTSAGSGGPFSFVWEFGDGTTSMLTDPVHTYTHPGVYVVTLIQVPSSGDRDTLRMTLTIAPAEGPGGTSGRPTNANFSYNIAYSGYTVTFINRTTGEATGYQWQFGDSGTSASVEDTVVHTYTGAGPYPVSLSASNSGGADTARATIHF